MTRRSPTSKAKRALKETVHKHFPFMLLHLRGCGAVAFYLQEMLGAHDSLAPDRVMYPDGTMPGIGKPAICFSCKAELTLADMQPEYVGRVQ